MSDLGRPKKNRTHIVDLLTGRLLLASQLSTELAGHGGMSRAAASRAIERAENAKQISSSNPVSFGAGRDHIYWLPETSRTQLYFSEVGDMLKNRPAFDCVVQALLSASGGLPERYLSRFIPAPLEVRFGRPTTMKILWDLKHLKVVEERHSADGRVIALSKEFLDVFPAANSPIPFQLLLRTEGLLLKVVAQWLQGTSMVAWNSVEMRNSRDGTPVSLNGFAFDLKAPTYLQPLVRQGEKPVPGFVVADINMSVFQEFEAKAFVRKLSFIRKRRNPPAVVGICFAESFEKEAFAILKKHGAMVVQFSRIGSRSLPELIRCIAQIFENVQAQPSCDFEKVLRAVEQLAGEREANMSGSIFELMIGRFLNQQGSTVRFFDKKVRGVLAENPVEREVDVVAENGPILQLVEAKGYHRFQPVELYEVQRFFDETAHVASKALKQDQIHSTVAHCFFTASYFKKDARDYLEKLKIKFAGSRKLRIEFMDGSELRAKWADEGLHYLIRYLERYFGTQRKTVYDPDTQAVIDAPAPEFEQFASTAPEPTETKSTQDTAAPESEKAEGDHRIPATLVPPAIYCPTSEDELPF